MKEPRNPTIHHEDESPFESFDTDPPERWFEGTRDYIARALVRYVSTFIDFAFECNVLGFRRLERVYVTTGRIVEKPLLPLAKKIDREAALEQMAREGWWG